MKILATVVGAFILVAVAAVGFGLLFSWPVELLANYVFTPSTLIALFGGPLTIWKAWGLNILCGFLFKSISSSSSK